MSHLIVLALMLLSLPVFAQDHSDLYKYAKGVPTADIDFEMQQMVAKEIGADVKIISSHYVLGKFIRMSNNDTWFILDGYYKLSNEKIVMLDWVYFPETKTKRAIENYKNYYEGIYLLGSHFVCNPYKRYWLYSPFMNWTRSKPGEDGVDKIYTSAKACDGLIP